MAVARPGARESSKAVRERRRWNQPVQVPRFLVSWGLGKALRPPQRLAEQPSRGVTGNDRHVLRPGQLARGHAFFRSLPKFGKSAKLGAVEPPAVRAGSSRMGDAFEDVSRARYLQLGRDAD